MPFSVLTDTQSRLLGELAHQRVRFVVAGGYAVRAHGHMRSVEDLDLFFDTATGNLERLRLALEAVGAEKIDEIVGHLSRPKKAKVIWEDVEFLPRMGDSCFEDVHERAIQISAGTLQLPVIPKQALVEAKHIAIGAENRGEKVLQDKEDLKALQDGKLSDL